MSEITVAKISSQEVKISNGKTVEMKNTRTPTKDVDGI